MCYLYRTLCPLVKNTLKGLLERGFEFTHEAVRDWEARFAPLMGSVAQWIPLAKSSVRSPNLPRQV